MSQFNQRLGQAADENRELLRILSQTDYAPPALQQNTAYITDLQSQIAKTDRELTKLHTVTEDERKDHVKYRDSVMRRFAHKLGGHKGQEKFQSKQEKEEREFLEAWQREREAQERREALTSALEQAQKSKHGLETDKNKHDQAQKELDQMYNSIFSGPTPEVPGEDQREQAVQDARIHYDQCQAQHGREKYAFDALQRAHRSLSQALADMGNAHDASRMDLMGGGMFTDMMERDSLSRGQVNLSECLRAMDDARRVQPAIPVLSEVTIDNGHMLSDVLFDGIFTDMAQHDRIKDSEAQMQRAMNHLNSIVTEQNRTVQAAQERLWQSSRQLEDARTDLQRIRAEAFERLGSSDGERFGQSDAPPAYAS